MKRSTRPVTWSALAVLTVLAGACSSVLGLNKDYTVGAAGAGAAGKGGSGGTAGRDGGGGAAGGSGGAAGGSGGAAGGSAGAAGKDGGRDAKTSDAADAAGDWCARQMPGYRLCSDFDQAGGVTQGFDIGLVTEGVGGTFALDSSTAVSAPSSALGTANPFQPGQTSGDRIEGTLWSLGATPSTIDCSLSWLPVSLSTVTNDYAHVVEFSFYSDAQQASSIMTLSINMQGDGKLILLEYYPTPSLDATHSISLTVQKGSWIPVDLSLTAGGSSTAYTVKVGSATLEGSLAAPLPAVSHAVLEVGPAYFAGNTNTNSPGWTFGYDNVVCY